MATNSREQRLEQRLQRCQEEYRALEEEHRELLQEIEKTPLAELTLVGFENGENGQQEPILLDTNGRRVKARAIPEVKEQFDDAEVGDTVWTNPDGLVVTEMTGRRAKGVNGNIKRKRDGKLLVDVQGMGEFWAPVNGHVDYEEVEPGWKAAVTKDRTVIDAWEEPSRARMQEPPDTTYDDVGGLDSQINRIQRKVMMPLEYAEGFDKLGIRTGGGVMLHGPPGTGKTLLARATAGEAEASFFSVKISDVLSKWFGESEANITSLFQKARQNAPSVIFFDEFEAMGNKRGNNGHGGASRAADNVVSAFLGELDGLEGREDVIVIGATNRIDMIDDALLRPGRFDEAVKVPPPEDKETGLEIAQVHLSDELPYEDEAEQVRAEIVDLTWEAAEEPTGALIEGFCNEVKVSCVERCGNDPQLGLEDVKVAADEVIY